MKIFYFLYSLKNSGGIERIITLKANYLAQEYGHEVSIVTTDNNTVEPFYSIDNSVKVINLNIDYDKALSYNILYRIFYYKMKERQHKKMIYKLVELEKPDVVISTFGIEMFVLSGLANCKKILEFHFSKNSRIKELELARRGLLWKIAENIQRYFQCLALQKYDKFVVLTEKDKRLWEKAKNIFVINNFIINSNIEVADLACKKVIAVGRFSRQKNFLELLNIWKCVCGKFPDWKLQIVGTGECKKELMIFIEQNNLSDSIELISPTKNIYDYYLNSSIYVMTSVYEGMPMVLLEAKSCGLPIVAYDCECGPSEIIRNGNDGFLIPEGNRREYIEKLTLLMNDNILRLQMGQESKKDCERFNQRKIMDKWNNLLYGEQ